MVDMLSRCGVDCQVFHSRYDFGTQDAQSLAFYMDFMKICLELVAEQDCGGLRTPTSPRHGTVWPFVFDVNGVFSPPELISSNIVSLRR